MNNSTFVFESNIIWMPYRRKKYLAVVHIKGDLNVHKGSINS